MTFDVLLKVLISESYLREFILTSRTASEGNPFENVYSALLSVGVAGHRQIRYRHG
jgi:hypothetical protein